LQTRIGVLARHAADALSAADAQLRRRQHQKGVLEPRRRVAIDRQMLGDSRSPPVARAPVTFYLTNVPTIGDMDAVATIQDPRLARFYGYWLSQKGHRRFPARCDIDPIDFSYLLGHVMMFDVVAPPPMRFRVRLHGTELTERAHYDLSGKCLDEMPDAQQRALVTARCEGLVGSGEPLVIRHDRILDGRLCPYEALWLPFSGDGSSVTMLLCAMIYDNWRSLSAA
jgi:hypothetical protein